MASIYNNTVSQEETVELLSDYAALDVILLAAETRGRGSSVKLWLESAQRTDKMAEMAAWEREDIDSQGKQIMACLLQAVSANQVSGQEPEDLWHHLATPTPQETANLCNTLGGSTPSEANIPRPKSRLQHVQNWLWRRLGTPISQETANLPKSLDGSAHIETDILRSKLQLQHVQNWSRFEARVDADWELSCKLDETLTEVLYTMSIYRHRGSAGPAALTPMSSPLRCSPIASNVGQAEPRCSPLMRLPTANGSQPLSSRRPCRSKYTDLLFLPGFKDERSPKPGINSALYDTCSICRQPDSIQTLLLQTSLEAETEHLPKPGQFVGHKYPFVLGNYPETDVILPITCCDACAFLLLQAGELPNGDRVTIALPLVSLQIQENRSLWERKLGEVYGHRFHQRIVSLVFLSTLCTTLEDLTDNTGPQGSGTLRRSLEWCCKELSHLSGISTRAGLSPLGSPLAGVVNDSMPLKEAIQVTFCGVHSLVQENPLLSYPIDGFLVLIRLAGLLGDIEPRYIERFVWRRLLYHFAEQHAQLQKQVGSKEAKIVLDGLVNEPPAAETEGSGIPAARIRRHTITLSSLEGTYLIPSSSDILEQFGRMEEHSSVILETTKYHPALAVFLHIMATIADGSFLITDVEDFFTRMQCRMDGLAWQDKDLRTAFERRESVDEVVAVRLIAAAYEQAKAVNFQFS